MSDIITTLHPKGDTETNLYPNIITDNIPDGAVTTPKIIDNAITTNKILNGSVTGNKIQDGTITALKIADSTIVEQKIANGAIIEQKIFNGAVTENKIHDGAVNTNKIKDNSITQIKMSFHLYRHEFELDATLSGNNYYFRIDLNTIIDISFNLNDITKAQFKTFWNNEFGDTPVNCWVYDVTNNKWVRGELIYLDDFDYFHVYIDTMPLITMTDTDITDITDDYKTIIF